MIMVVKQAIHMNYCIIPLGGRFEIFEEFFPIAFTLEYILPLVAP